jgi:hypothetical protein
MDIDELLSTEFPTYSQAIRAGGHEVISFPEFAAPPVKVSEYPLPYQGDRPVQPILRQAKLTEFWADEIQTKICWKYCIVPL